MQQNPLPPTQSATIPVNVQPSKIPVSNIDERQLEPTQIDEHQINDIHVRLQTRLGNEKNTKLDIKNRRREMSRFKNGLENSQTRHW